jgi:SNF2 family DNA or RNA helicase
MKSELQPQSSADDAAVVEVSAAPPSSAASSSSSSSGERKVRLGDISKWLKSDYVSTKTREVVKILQAVHEENDVAKVLVFSQFVEFFPYLGKLFDEEGVQFERYEGSMDVVEREEALTRFRFDSSITVLLCSLKCAAFGLNIVEASHIIITDPW